MSKKLKLKAFDLRMTSIKKPLDPVVTSQAQFIKIIKMASKLGFTNYSVQVKRSKIPSIISFIRTQTDLQYWGPADSTDNVVEVAW